MNSTLTEQALQDAERRGHFTGQEAAEGRIAAEWARSALKLAEAQLAVVEQVLYTMPAIHVPAGVQPQLESAREKIVARIAELTE